MTASTDDFFRSRLDHRVVMKKSHLYIVHLCILFTIAVAVIWMTGFRWGEIVLGGDFRSSLWPSARGDLFLNLVSQRFSNSNFVYLSFLPLYRIIAALDIQTLLIFIYFVIPALTYCFSYFFLEKIIQTKSWDARLSVVNAVLAFCLALNPTFFVKLVHWPILFSRALFPLFALAVITFVQSKKRLYAVIPVVVLLHFGGISPFGFVAYMGTLFLASALIAASDESVVMKIRSISLLAIASFVAYAHIIYAASLGLAETRSIYEAPMTSNIFSFLGKHANVISAISATNFNEELIKFPAASIWFVLFSLVGFAFLLNKSSRRSKLFLYSILLLAVIVALQSGYRTFPMIYDLLMTNSVTNAVIWIVKEPNTFIPYSLLLLGLVVALACKYIIDQKISMKLILIGAALICSGNVIFFLSSETTEFRKYFQFHKVPAEYFEAADYLETIGGRNLWFPISWYAPKKYFPTSVHYPSPAYWLTRNKELIDTTVEYSKLLREIDSEIYENRCYRKEHLAWLAATQELNLLIDLNTVNLATAHIPDARDRVRLARKCLMSLPGIKLVRTIGPIEIYRSEVASNPPILSSVEGAVTSIATSQIYVLNESFQMNWRDSHGTPPVARVNKYSMGFGSPGPFVYRGQYLFYWITQVQFYLILTMACMILFLRPNKYY